MTIHDMRYNLIPEILTPNISQFSGGFQTRYVGDGDGVGTVKFGINDRFEVGSKFTWVTTEKLDHMYALLDLGGKVALDPARTLQTDIVLGMNNDNGGGVILTYTQMQSYSKRFSAILETRLGLLEAATEGNWAAFELGAYPQFHLAQPIYLRIGMATGTTLRHPVNSFQVDLIPGLQVDVLRYLHVFAEFAVGIIGNDDVRLALHFALDF